MSQGASSGANDGRRSRPSWSAAEAPAQRTTVWVVDRVLAGRARPALAGGAARGAEAGFDGIFVPIGDGLDARYLTQLRNSSIVLPTDGRPPVVVTDRGASNAWVPEPRHTVRVWGKPMADALLRSGDGARPHRRRRAAGRPVEPRPAARRHDQLHGLRSGAARRCPTRRSRMRPTWSGQVRYVKSAEEIICLRHATQMAEAGVGDAGRSRRGRAPTQRWSTRP